MELLERASRLVGDASLELVAQDAEVDDGGLGWACQGGGVQVGMPSVLMWQVQPLLRKRVWW